MNTTFFLLAFVVFLSSCQAPISFKEPRTQLVHPGPTARFDGNDERELVAFYRLQPLAVNLDESLGGLQEVAGTAASRVPVLVGEAVAWAFQHQPDSPFALSLHKSSYGDSVYQGGSLQGVSGMLHAQSEVKYALHVSYSGPRREPVLISAYGSSKNLDGPKAIREAVEEAVAELHTKVSFEMAVDASDVP